MARNATARFAALLLAATLALECAGPEPDPPCEDRCAAGERRCHQSGGLTTCDAVSDEGCLDWGEPVACPPHLRCDEELVECWPDTPSECYELNECLFEGQLSCVDEVNYRTCIRTPRTGCLMFNGCPTCAPTWEACPEGTRCVEGEESAVCE